MVLYNTIQDCLISFIIDYDKHVNDNVNLVNRQERVNVHIASV